MDTILVTGGAGFIGSAVVRQLVRDGKRVINFDKLTYAGNPESLKVISNAPNHRLVEGDILDSQTVLDLLREEQVDGIMHLAAESHVDRSMARAPSWKRTWWALSACSKPRFNTGVN